MIFSNNMKFEKLGYYPFILNINDAERLYRFYNGDLLIFVVVSLDYVESQFRARGFHFRMSSDPQWPWQIYESDPDKSARTGYHFIGRLGSEFLSLSWLVEELAQRSMNLRSGTLA